jgi:probable phosphoglycerate mutase
MTPEPTELIFIRHGETDWNRQQRFQGQIDVPLNETGRAQAARLAQRLADERCDVLVCSDLVRARETAAALARTWRTAAQPDAAFREQSFGIVDGLDVPTIQQEHADLWALWLEQRADFQLPGGESLREFHARVMAGLHALVRQHAGKTVTVVSHGGVLDMLWRSAHGLPIEGLRSCDIPNTGINRLRWADGALSVVTWADAAHLDEPG